MISGKAGILYLRRDSAATIGVLPGGGADLA